MGSLRFCLLHGDDGFDVDEFADAEQAQFAAITALFDAAKGKARVGADEVVHEAAAGLEVARSDAFAARAVVCEDGSAKSERGVVCNPNSVRFISRADDRGDRSEGFLAVSRLAGADIRQDGRRVKGGRGFLVFSAEENPGARSDAGVHLFLQRDAEIRSSERAKDDIFVERVAETPGLHFFGEEFFELSAQLFDDNEAFGGDAALAGVDQARGDATLGGGIEVGVFEHDVGIGPAKFEDGFLEDPASLGRDRSPGRSAAGECNGAHEWVFDEFADAVRADDDGAKDVEARVAQKVVDGLGAAEDVRGVFEDDGVAGHQGGGDGAKDLPEGEVPWHDREDDAEWQVGDEAPGQIGLDFLRGEKFLGVVGVEVAPESALLDFGAPLGERLPHLERHEPGEGILSLPQECGSFAHRRRPREEIGAAPSLECGVKVAEDFVDFVARRFVVARDPFAGGGVARFKVHRFEFSIRGFLAKV